MEYIARFLAEAVVAAAAEPPAPEGGIWTESDQSRLIRLAVTGTQTGKFHSDGVFPLKWRDGDAFRPAPDREGRPPLALAAAIRLLLRAPAGALAEAALRGRREGSVPAAPVLALVFLAYGRMVAWSHGRMVAWLNAGRSVGRLFSSPTLSRPNEDLHRRPARQTP